MDNQRKDHPDLKRTPKRNPPSQQKQIHNMPTDDIENTNSTNQSGDLLFIISCGLIPEEQKGTKRTRDLLYNNQHILKESSPR